MENPKLVDFFVDLRGLNTSLKATMDSFLVGDPNADLSLLYNQYQTHLDSIRGMYADTQEVDMYYQMLSEEVNGTKEFIYEPSVSPSSITTTDSSINSTNTDNAVSATNSIDSADSTNNGKAAAFSFMNTTNAPTTIFAPTSTPNSFFNAKAFGTTLEQESTTPEEETDSFTQIRTNDALVHTGAGEEQETTLHQVRAKLFKFSDGKWKDSGIGILKLNRSIQDPNSYRLLSRMEGSGNLLLNVRTIRDLGAKREKKNVLVPVAMDGNITKINIRVKTEAEAVELYDALEAARQ